MPPYGETPATIQQHETARLILSYGLNCAAGQGEAPLPYESWTDVALVLADGSTLALGRKITTVCARHGSGASTGTTHPSNSRCAGAG